MKEISLDEGFKNLKQGSHLCSIYSGKEEQLSILEPYLRFGLTRNEKLLYIVSDRTKEEIINYFKNKEANFDIQNLIDSGQFEFLTEKESYLEGGSFEPEAMFELLTNAKERALENGFSGLRGVGETMWFFSDAPGVGQLMKYESQLNEFVQGNETVLLCLYNEDEFSSERLLDVIYTHPRILINDSLYENHYYMPPDIFATRMKEEVDRDYYEEIKNDIEKKAKVTGEQKRNEKEEDLDFLVQTIENLEKISS